VYCTVHSEHWLSLLSYKPLCSVNPLQRRTVRLSCLLSGWAVGNHGGKLLDHPKREMAYKYHYQERSGAATRFRIWFQRDSDSKNAATRSRIRSRNKVLQPFDYYLRLLVRRSTNWAPHHIYIRLQTVRHRFNIYVTFAMLPWRCDAKMGTANSLHASA